MDKMVHGPDDILPYLTVRHKIQELQREQGCGKSKHKKKNNRQIYIVYQHC